MVSTNGIIAIVVALAGALLASFVINNFVLKREFDITSTIVDIVIVGVILFVGSMIAKKTVGSKGIENPKVNI